MPRVTREGAGCPLFGPGVPSCTSVMVNSESATQEWTLATVGTGELVEVQDIGCDEPEMLLVHGIRPGARLAVEADAPFGGPRIVRAGGHRVAIARRLARLVRVVPVGEERASPESAHR